MRIRVLLIALSLFGASWAVAQDDAKKSDTEKKTAESGKAGDSQDSVYTKDDLREQIDGSAKSPSVIYNENLKSKTAEKGDAPAIVFTNESLTKRYGEPDPAPAPSARTEDALPFPGIDPDPDAGADPNADPGAEPEMSSEQRTQRIAEIEEQIKRLEKRTLAIRNPFLAGTYPATDEERTEEKGMRNPDRLKKVETQIEDLRAELQELRSGA